jgi:hypothetical protein
VVSLKGNRSDLFGSGWLALDLRTSQIQVQCSAAELEMKMKANMQDIIMVSGKIIKQNNSTHPVYLLFIKC